MISNTADKLNGIIIRVQSAIRNKVAESQTISSAFGAVIAVVLGIILLGALTYIVKQASIQAANKVTGAFNAVTTEPSFIPTGPTMPAG